MLKKIWDFAVLDLRIWTRMPMVFVSAIVPPAGMALLLLVLTLSVGKQPVALVVGSRGKEALRMADIIEKDAGAYILTLTDPGTASKMLSSQEAAAVITIPGDFDRRIDAGGAILDLKINNIDIDFSDDIRRSADRCVAEFNAPGMAMGGQDEGKGEDRDPYALMNKPNPYLIDIAEDDLRETNVGFLSYQLIPVLMLLILSVGLTGSAMSGARDRESRIFSYILMAPASSLPALIAGRILCGLMASLSVTILTVAVCVLTGVISVPPGHWPALSLLFITTSFCASGLGIFLGSLIRGTGLIAMTGSTIAAFMFFLGGGFTTIAFLPGWLRIVSSFVPMRYAIDGLRQALFYPGLTGIPADLAVLSSSASASITAGIVMLRKSWTSSG